MIQINHLKKEYGNIVPIKDIDKIRMKVGMVFQSFNLYKHMTVLKNVMFAPMKLLKKSESEAKEKAMELLEMVVANFIFNITLHSRM